MSGRTPEGDASVQGLWDKARQDASAEPRRYLSKAQILAQDDLPVEEVHVPEWDTWVRVRTLTGAERDYFEASIVQRNGRNVTQNLSNVRARLCALCIVDEQGKRIFAEEDEYALGKKSAAALDRIFSTAQRLNGLRDEDVAELAKNSPAAPNDASPSA